MLDDFYWSTHSTAVAIGNPRDVNDIFGFQDQLEAPLYEGKGMYTIFDTGSSDILISQIYFMDLIKKIFSKVGGKEWSFKDGVLYTKCYNNFPSLFFAVSGRWIELRPSDYVYDTSLARDRSNCVLKLKSLDLPYIVLGNPIFIDYYTIHDSERGRMGIAPHSLSSKRDIEVASTPKYLIQSKMEPASEPPTYWSWILAALILIAFVVIYFVLIWPLVTAAYVDVLT